MLFHRSRKQLKELFIFELIKNENTGMPMTPVFPWFISSGDDLTNFCSEGKSKEDTKLYLVDASCDSTTRSHFFNNTGSTDGCRGIGIRQSVTMTAAGNIAYIWETIYGLREKELPREKTQTRYWWFLRRYFLWRIPELCG